ncbi:MAG TPA: hypothetical protein VH302_14695 [Bryobacteraceae bacterium]|jgi:hypothetical protein|nr:hypothetical protein [Bryobacteraceae bacterium]
MENIEGPDTGEQTRIQFLDNEMDLCDTFLNVALVDADNPKAATSARTEARRGYETALAWINSVRDAEERARLAAKLFRLKDRLDKIGA